MHTTIKTVKTSEFEMDYFHFGNGPRTAVILPGISVKSVMDSADAVVKQYAIWEEEFTTYLFDRRKDLPDHYTIADMARDTAAAMRELGLSNVCLFGASQGGMIALALTIDNPDLVGKLALGSTTARVTSAPTSENHDETPGSLPADNTDTIGYFDVPENSDETSDAAGSISSWVDLARSGDARALYREFGKRIYPQALFEQYKDVLEGLGNFVTKEDLDRFITIAEGTDGFDVSASLVKITCPVLILGSNDDEVIPPACSFELKEGLTSSSDCKLYMYDGCGHAAFDTAPDYQKRLLDFFR
ncbi:MAG: alpha/beta hydrolase [Clostridiales bacterium]|nr:alpha/beta hydrolase [Clostridiales bacterium]